jgi:hypothetical protein
MKTPEIHVVEDFFGNRWIFDDIGVQIVSGSSVVFVNGWEALKLADAIVERYGDRRGPEGRAA